MLKSTENILLIINKYIYKIYYIILYVSKLRKTLGGRGNNMIK